MKLADFCSSSVAFFVYCSVVASVIVKGHPTIDDCSDKHGISELISVVAELRAELDTVRSELAIEKDERAKALARISNLEGKLVKLMGDEMQAS